MTLSANFTSKSVFDKQGCRALTFALAKLSCYATADGAMALVAACSPVQYDTSKKNKNKTANMIPLNENYNGDIADISR